MTRLEGMLRGERPAGVLRGRSVPATATIERLASDYGWTLREVDLRGVEDKAGFIEAWAVGLAFPAWHGKNWDAFEELLHDLSWLGTPAGCIVVARGMLKGDSDVDFGMAIVEEAVGRRRAGEIGLIVIVV